MAEHPKEMSTTVSKKLRILILWSKRKKIKPSCQLEKAPAASLVSGKLIEKKEKVNKIELITRD